MDGGCWVLAGWTCNERATMLYALYVLYVRVRGCRLWRYVRKCWGCYAMLCACSALCLALRLVRMGSNVMQCR